MPSAQTPLIELPGCKSASARALVLSAFGEGEMLLTGLSNSEDTNYLLESISALGAQVNCSVHGLEVQGLQGLPSGENISTNAGEAATNLRLLMAFAAVTESGFAIRASSTLCARPHHNFVDFLKSHGQEVELLNDCWRVGQGVLPSGEWSCDPGSTSQFHSGLALAAVCHPFAKKIRLRLPDNLPSKGYFNLSLQMIDEICGANTMKREDGFVVFKPTLKRVPHWTCPADASSASFFLSWSLLNNQPISFDGWWSKHHPENAFIEFLCGAGLGKVKDCKFTPLINLQNQSARAEVMRLHLNIDLFPDVAPALAVLAATLENGVAISGVERLVHKESNRLLGMQRLVEASGGCFKQLNAKEVWIGRGRELKSGAVIDCANDHRLAMAAAIAEHIPDNKSYVAKSFPNFWTELNKCTG